MLLFSEPNIPTSKKVEFFLHTVPQTWNEASRICQSGGGKLMRIDGVSKRHVLENYIDSWQTDGHM